MRAAPQSIEPVLPPGVASRGGMRWAERLRPRMSAGNAVELLESGGEYFPRLIADLDAAGDEVFFETYIFNRDRSGDAVAQALARAARRGVRVHVIIDGFGTRSLDPGLRETMHEAGVELRVFKPGSMWRGFDRRRLRRMHRKLVVIDGAIGYVGGINVLDDLHDPNHGALEHPRLDYAVRVRGPVLPSLHLAAARLWWQVDRLHGPRLASRDGMRHVREAAVRALRPPGLANTVEPCGSLRAMLVLRDNLRWRKRIESSYLLLMRQARREILIANAYFIPGRRFRQALLQAAARGVRVRLLLQGRIEYPLPHYATQSLYDELLRAGIEIVEYRRSFLHAKVAVIDDWAIVGSSNIDPLSLLLAREANLVVNDAGFARGLRDRLLSAIADGGDPVRPQHLAQRAWPMRVLHSASWALMRLGVAISGASRRY